MKLMAFWACTTEQRIRHSDKLEPRRRVRCGGSTGRDRERKEVVENQVEKGRTWSLEAGATSRKHSPEPHSRSRKGS